MRLVCLLCGVCAFFVFIACIAQMTYDADFLFTRVYLFDPRSNMHRKDGASSILHCALPVLSNWPQQQQLTIYVDAQDMQQVLRLISLVHFVYPNLQKKFKNPVLCVVVQAEKVHCMPGTALPMRQVSYDGDVLSIARRKTWSHNNEYYARSSSAGAAPSYFHANNGCTFSATNPLCTCIFFPVEKMVIDACRLFICF